MVSGHRPRIIQHETIEAAIRAGRGAGISKASCGCSRCAQSPKCPPRICRSSKASAPCLATRQDQTGESQYSLSLALCELQVDHGSALHVKINVLPAATKTNTSRSHLTNRSRLHYFVEHLRSSNAEQKQIQNYLPCLTVSAVVAVLK